jgi:hypothetical protein
MEKSTLIHQTDENHEIVLIKRCATFFSSQQSQRKADKSKWEA